MIFYISIQSILIVYQLLNKREKIIKKLFIMRIVQKKILKIHLCFQILLQVYIKNGWFIFIILQMLLLHQHLILKVY